MKCLPVMTLLLLLIPALVQAEERRKIRSIKALTHTLSEIEKAHGTAARMVTLNLQVYLEDAYIAQGSVVWLQPEELSAGVAEVIAEGGEISEAGARLLHRYREGRFHD